MSHHLDILGCMQLSSAHIREKKTYPITRFTFHQVSIAYRVQECKWLEIPVHRLVGIIETAPLPTHIGVIVSCQRDTNALVDALARHHRLVSRVIFPPPSDHLPSHLSISSFAFPLLA